MATRPGSTAEWRDVAADCASMRTSWESDPASSSAPSARLTRGHTAPSGVLEKTAMEESGRIVSSSSASVRRIVSSSSERASSPPISWSFWRRERSVNVAGRAGEQPVARR